MKEKQERTMNRKLYDKVGGSEVGKVSKRLFLIIFSRKIKVR